MRSPIFKGAISLLLTLTLHHCANSNGMDIVRGEYDRFTNIAGLTDKRGGCSKMNAVCFGKDCTYCRCMEDQTFVRRKGCVSNELMAYATSYETTFLLHNQNQRCFYQTVDGSDIVEGQYVCSKKYGNSLWTWTNFGQLLNWASLQCMTDDYSGYPLRMRKCDRTNQMQLWKCVGDKKYNIVQEQSGRYMYNGNGYNDKYVITKDASSSDLTKWTRYSTKNDVCSQAVGCEMFADGSSLVIVNITKCKERSKCLEEKKINLKKKKCFLLSNKTQYIHNETWKALKIKNGSFDVTSSADKVSLKWNLKKTPKSWGGLMVKIQFMCEDTIATKAQYCVVIKYAGTFTGFRNYDKTGGDGEDTDGKDDNGKDDNEGDVDDDGGTGGDHGNNGSNITNKIDTDTKLVSNGDNKDNSKTIIIILVCVIVILLLIGVVGIITCRHRNRHGHGRSKKSYRENQDQNRPSTLKELTVPLNPLQASSSNQSTQRESHQYEVPCEHLYEYIPATAPPQSSDYDYAFVDGPPTNKQEASTEPGRIREEEIENDAEDTSYITVIEPKPDTEDTHDDYVIPDVSYVSVIG